MLRKMIILIGFIAVSFISVNVYAKASQTNQPEINNAYSMPASSPAYPEPPYRFINREFFIITYETDMDALRKVVPEPLEIPEPIVKYEFIKMPDSSGLGSYTESGQVIPVIYKGEKAQFVLSMFLDNEPAIAAGREIWGYPKKLASPWLGVDPISKDTLVGRLKYGEVDVAVGTMGYKFKALDVKPIEIAMAQTPIYMLKIIPAPNGKTAIRQLVKVELTDVTVKGAWTGPADLQLFRHAMAPVANLPIKRIISGTHIISDLTLQKGEVAYDYLPGK